MTWLGSVLWSLVNAVARSAVRPIKWAVPVVSIGNVEAGGTGKTPWVIAVAQFLARQGKIPVILSRGYGGSLAQQKLSGIAAPSSSAGDSRNLDPLHWGDECAEIAERVPEAWIGVGSRREEAWYQIQAKLGPQELTRVVVILDDGLQQFGIARNLDLVLVTGRRPSRFLFRDLFFGSASRGHGSVLWIWTKDEQLPRRWSNRASDARWKIPFALHASQPIAGKNVFLVCGVGHPEAVGADLREIGAKVVGTVRRPDHAVYSREQILKYAVEAVRHGAILVTTSKDSVKWKRVLRTSDLVPWVVIEPRPQAEGFLAVSARLLRAVQVE